jgi:hypothetical protein
MAKRFTTVAAAAVPPPLSLKRISKKNKSESCTPPTKDREKIYSNDNFPLKQIFLNEYLQKHPKISDFLGEQGMQNFYTLLNQHFFEWINHRKNSQKMVYEIKREFMSIAEAVLLFEVTNEQRRLTPHAFVIGPLQKILEDCAKGSEPENLGVIPYSRPLQLRPVSSKLEDTRHQIMQDDMRLSGVESIDDSIPIIDIDVSEFFK